VIFFRHRPQPDRWWAFLAWSLQLVADSSQIPLWDQPLRELIPRKSKSTASRFCV